MLYSKPHRDILKKENRERTKLAVRQLGNRIMDVLVEEMEQEFDAAVDVGTYNTYSLTPDEVLPKMIAVAQRALDAG